MIRFVNSPRSRCWILPESRGRQIWQSAETSWETSLHRKQNLGQQTLEEQRWNDPLAPQESFLTKCCASWFKPYKRMQTIKQNVAIHNRCRVARRNHLQ